MPGMVQGVQTEEVFQPLGKWKPDTAVPLNDGMPFMLNGVPRDDSFYGPEGAAEVFSSQSTTPFGNALKVHGSIHSQTSIPGGDPPRYYVGTFATAAGDSRIVSRLEQGAWSDLSKVGGYLTIGSTPWRFANFGLKVLAVQLGTPLQISDGGAGVFRDVSANIRGKDVATVRGFAVMVNINDTTYGEGTQPFRVWWSIAGDAETWPDPTSDAAINGLSAFRDLFDGGRLNRIITGIGGADAIVVSERKMWRMNFVGAPEVFQFDQIETDQGTSIPGSIAAFNETFFFYGHNGFYWFDGTNSRPIGKGSIDNFFVNDLDFSAAFGSQNAVQAGIDSEKSCYVLSYRSSAAPDDHNDKILRYNWLTDTWSNSELAVDSTGQVDSQNSTTDTVRIISIDAAFELVRFTGAALEATFESRENVFDDASYTQINGVIPFVDAELATAFLRVRDFLYQTLVDSSPPRTWQEDGYIRFYPDVINGRFYRCQIKIPAGATWATINGMLYQYVKHGYGPRRTT